MGGEHERARVRSYQDLDVWRSGMDLVERIYERTQSFPKEEMFGLTAQMRRAGVSIPSNIAEGWGRESTGSYIQSVRIAQGSLKELETQIILSRRIGLLDADEERQLIEHTDQLGRMIRGLLRSLEAKS